MPIFPGFYPGTRWGSLHAALPNLLAGGEGARCPLPQNLYPYPALAFGLEFLPFGS